MEFQGNVAIAATQTAVWHTLTTPEIVGQCTPRLQGWSPLETDTQFHLQFCWGNGKSAILIPVLLTWQTVTPPTYLQWTGEAKMGKTAVPIQGDFSLASHNANQTTLTFAAQLHPTNKMLAHIVQTTAPRLIESFFHCLKTTAEAV